MAYPQFDAKTKISVTIDGKSFSVRTPDAVSFSMENGAWKNKKFTPGRFSKQPGAEGPLSDAISSNHIYVYGTQGDPSREELQARQLTGHLTGDLPDV